jgi:hypothetical protein
MAQTIDTNGKAAGLAALAICESLLLALTELKVLDDREKRGVLEDAAAAHQGAEALALNAADHAAAAALIKRMIVAHNGLPLT